MRFTALHLGLMAPIICRLRSWLALTSYTLANLWIDNMAIHAVLTGQPLPSHDQPPHTLVGALMIGLLLAISALVTRSVAWVAGLLRRPQPHPAGRHCASGDAALRPDGRGGQPALHRRHGTRVADTGASHRLAHRAVRVSCPGLVEKAPGAAPTIARSA
jgi:hypothetical protein